MVAFSTDSDLLGYEPGIFVDIGVVGQRKLLVSDGEVDGCELSSVTGGFSALLAGDVVVLEDASAQKGCYEVESIDNNNTVTLGRSPVGFGNGSGLGVEVVTLSPQRELVNEELLRAVTADSDDDAVTVDAVVSTDVMRNLEVLGTLWRGYVGVIGVGDENDGVAEKAAFYGEQFRLALRSASVVLDLDGDGEGDVIRRPSIGRLIRA